MAEVETFNKARQDATERSQTFLDKTLRWGKTVFGGGATAAGVSGEGVEGPDSGPISHAALAPAGEREVDENSDSSAINTPGIDAAPAKTLKNPQEIVGSVFRAVQSNTG